MPSPKETLKEYVDLLVERKVREADLSDGSRTKHGSSKHIKDLERRIKELVHFRDRHKRGSEKRSEYSRLIGRLKSELSSAKRSGVVDNPIHEVEGGDAPWWKDPDTYDPDSPKFVHNRWERMAEEPEFKPYIDSIKAAADPKELARVKKSIDRAIDAGETSMPDGMWLSFYEQRKKELRDMNAKPTSAADARTDRILRIRDSSGKATARKWR